MLKAAKGYKQKDLTTDFEILGLLLDFKKLK